MVTITRCQRGRQWRPYDEMDFPRRRLHRRNPDDRRGFLCYCGPMRMTNEAMYARVLASDASYNGRFFTGVLTIVNKLLNLTDPDMAFFGQKDAAQVAIVRRMVRDLNLPVEIVACPIVREPDGLAMSSRNAYLDPQQRKRALVLHRGLLQVKKSWEEGEREAGKLLTVGRDELAAEKSVRLDYLEIVDPDSLDPVKNTAGGALVAVAAFVGLTRLIDNLVLPKSSH